MLEKIINNFHPRSLQSSYTKPKLYQNKKTMAELWPVTELQYWYALFMRVYINRAQQANQNDKTANEGSFFR